MIARRILALARYSVAANWRTSMTRMGPAILLAVTLLGPAASLKNHGAWIFDVTMLMAGFIFGAVFVLRSGLVDQRDNGLDGYFRQNFVSPLEHMAAAVLAAVANLAIMLGFMFLAGLVVSAGDVPEVAWLVWIALLMGALMFPFVIMVEAGFDLRTPLFVPAFVYLLVMVTLAIIVGSEEAASILAINVDPVWPASSLPLAARAGVALTGGLILVLVFTWLRAAPRRRRERA